MATLVCCAITFGVNVAMGAAGGGLVANCDRRLDAINATSTLLPCACPNGNTGTEYECPLNWSYNVRDGVCKRASSSGSDATGWYTAEYGTCAAEEGSYDCWAVYSCDNRPTDHITDCICRNNACS